ncbi:transglutaminase domain-containing protein [[Leptolyngbya] sp. PCC 7376]|uniref:transglutaminase-like domain-containing protein n=1 Tax=[Leptolyngbya] sp. PCC 7376 TaxID=111781 RepID=UPI00029F052B|nr:transglutaminase-like domain-containing protein [[Leptolyngbya] sp. PCC 7376]AFY39071.1 transglutaminase domain-containing protein [[Leptolyngbya] sp. PCC 7376]
MNRLKMYPLLLGLAMIFWGWHNGQQIFFAIPMAITYEAHHLIRTRWNFSDVDIRRAASVATVALIGIYTFIAVTGSWLQALSIFFQWLPLTVFPIVLLQTYSDSKKINFRSLLLFVKFDPKIAKKKRNFDVIYPFFVVCILCASGRTEHGLSFYFALLFISLFPLWQLRSNRFKLVPWLCAMVIAANLGFVSQLGIRAAHKYTEQQAISWLSKFYQGEADPFQQNTSLGEIGAIKQSNAIAFRVKSPNNETVPRLLREAAYNKYQGGLWITTENEFQAANSADDETTWQWQQTPEQHDSIIITDQTIKDKAIAKLPSGSFRLQNFPAETAEYNQYGVVRLESEKKNLQYQVDFNADQNFDVAPIPDDLDVPNSEAETLDQIIQDNNLKSENSTKSLSNLEGFFLKDFSYTLNLTGDGDRPTPLASFLLDQKQGHCEYFATATTLLLREMGIPARYAVGYSVHDFSELEQQYIVRDRHAHAWTLVYVDGQWQNFDTTPSNWADIEDQEAKGFTLVGDFFSWGWLQIKTIFGSIFTPENIQRWWWVILPILLLRLWFSTSGDKESLGRKILQRRKKNQSSTLVKSKFKAIEEIFNQLGFPRSSSQPLKEWLQELRQNQVTAEMATDLDEILRWYYRDRFDPQGLDPNDIQSLDNAIKKWLKRWHYKTLALK